MFCAPDILLLIALPQIRKHWAPSVWWREPKWRFVFIVENFLSAFANFTQNRLLLFLRLRIHEPRTEMPMQRCPWGIGEIYTHALFALAVARFWRARRFMRRIAAFSAAAAIFLSSAEICFVSSSVRYFCHFRMVKARPSSKSYDKIIFLLHGCQGRHI
jgi:hypothetical protein